MSTRATILYGKNWHIFDELLDNQIYMEFSEGSVNILFRLMNSEELPADLREILRKWREVQSSRDAAEHPVEQIGTGLPLPISSTSESGADLTCKNCGTYNYVEYAKCINCGHLLRSSQSD